MIASRLIIFAAATLVVAAELGGQGQPIPPAQGAPAAQLLSLSKRQEFPELPRARERR